MGYHHGLKLEGDVWVYKFVLNGLPYRGSTKCRVYEEAVKWLNHFRSEVSLGHIGAGKAPTLEKLLEEWETTACLSNDQQQISSMVSAIRTHFKSLLKVHIDMLHTPLVKGCLVRYTKTKGKGPGRKKHSSGGANALLLRLNTLMGFAIDCNYIRKKPYAIKREKSQEQPRTIIRAGKTKVFLAALNKAVRSVHIRLAILLQAGLGLRESEALGAEWQWINWDSNEIHVVRFHTPVDRTEKKHRTKNKRIRTLPLPSWLRERLHAHWESAGRPKAGLVLPSDRPGRPHAKRYTAKALERVGKLLELEGLTPHSLRAGWITSLLHDAKVSLSETQKLAGHAEPTTTSIYDQGAEHHRDAILALERAQGMLPAKGRGQYRKLKTIGRFKLVSIDLPTIEKQ